MPFSTSASTVELQCGSSIDCINHGAWKILANQADIVIAGGTESFSQLSRNYATSVEPYRLGTIKLLEFELQPPEMEGRKYIPLTEMGLTAENLVERYKISRQEQDEFALRSQTLAKKPSKRVISSRRSSRFLFPRARKNPPMVFKVDEFPRLSSLEKLAALPLLLKREER